jgi:hypothetical protein
VTRGSHLALAAERGELVPLPAFLERAWEILREVPAEPGARTRTPLFVLEGGGCGDTEPTPRPELRLVGTRRRYP